MDEGGEDGGGGGGEYEGDPPPYSGGSGESPRRRFSEFSFEDHVVNRREPISSPHRRMIEQRTTGSSHPRYARKSSDPGMELRCLPEWSSDVRQRRLSKSSEMQRRQSLVGPDRRRTSVNSVDNKGSGRLGSAVISVDNKGLGIYCYRVNRMD